MSQLDGVSVDGVGFAFVCGSSLLTPQSMESIVEVCDGDATSVEAGNFLARDTTIQSVRFAPSLASHVRRVGDCTLAGCRFIVSTDFSGLVGSRIIGNSFLSGCERVTALDFSDFTSLTSVGDSFLSDCRELTSLDLSGLTSVTSIGDSAFAFCRALSALDLRALTAVIRIGNAFLCASRQLTSLNFQGLTSLVDIGVNFLKGCSALTSVDLSGLSALTSIPPYFLVDCPALTALDMSGLTSVTKVANDFLADSKAVTALDLGGWSALTTLDTGFLRDCPALTTLDVTEWASIQSLGERFLGDGLPRLSHLRCRSSGLPLMFGLGWQHRNRLPRLRTAMSRQSKRAWLPPVAVALCVVESLASRPGGDGFASPDDAAMMLLPLLAPLGVAECPDHQRGRHAARRRVRRELALAVTPPSADLAAINVVFH